SFQLFIFLTINKVKYTFNLLVYIKNFRTPSLIEKHTNCQLFPLPAMIIDVHYFPNVFACRLPLLSKYFQGLLILSVNRLDHLFQLRSTLISLIEPAVLSPVAAP